MTRSVPDHERATVGALLLAENREEAARLIESAGGLEARHFQHSGVGAVWRAAVELVGAGQAPDPVSVAAALVRGNGREPHAFLGGLLDGVPRVRDLAQWAALIRDGAHDPDGPDAEREPHAAPSWRFLRPLTVAALYADKTLAAIRWLWDGMFPDGALILVASFQKEGKSTWLYALLAALVRGRPFLGRQTRAVRVLVLAVEEHMRDVLAHLRAAGIGPDDERVTVHSGRYPATPEGYAELRSFIRQNRIELLVVDTLARFWCIRDENSNAEVIEKAGPLLDLARDENVTVLLFHHTTDKAGTGAGEFRHGREIRGASALFGLVDQAFLLSRAKGQASTVRVLRSVGRYHETPAELLMDFDPETGAYRLLDTAGNLEEERRQAREHKLLGYIAEHPGERRTDVQRGARVNRAEGLSLLARLLSEGRIEEHDGGLYLPGIWVPRGLGNPPEPGPRVPGSGRPLKGGRRNPTRTLAEPDGTDMPRGAR